MGGLSTEAQDIEPMLLGTESLGCNTCCNGGSCDTAYNDQFAGMCCAGGMNPQCCPGNFHSRSYHCQDTGGGNFGCAPGAGNGGFQAPSYQPPPQQPATY